MPFMASLCNLPIFKNYAPSLTSFTRSEKRNLLFYILGIMSYKLALETLNGCVASMVMKRMDPSVGPNRLWTIMLSINYACQCIGSILVSPLAKRFRTHVVLSRSILAFGAVVLIVPILEGATGGGSVSGLGNEADYNAGTWNPYLLFAIFPTVGIFHGMIELIRRIIPSDIVGSDEIKLKQLDSAVHICYETAGTFGALLAGYWMTYFNYAYALAVIPICFTIASLFWMNIRLEREEKAVGAGEAAEVETTEKSSIIGEVRNILGAFAHSIMVGGKLVLTRRSLVWLIPAYSLPLVLHRYLENVLFAQYAVTGLDKGSYQQRLIAGSNLGELMGAFFVLMFANAVSTPLPWLRLDAVALLVVWIFPLVQPAAEAIDMMVWVFFAVMIVVSFGWAAGDVSLVAYVQARLHKMDNLDERTSPLGAVMAFLYVLYITLFAIVSPLMGSVMDSFLRDLSDRNGGVDHMTLPFEERMTAVRNAMFYTAGIFMTFCAFIILLATLIPRGAFAMNPVTIDDDEDILADEERQRRVANADEGLDDALKAKYKKEQALTELIAG